MRSMEETLERLVCAGHCRFYKPWSSPSKRCGAFHWLLQRSAQSATTLAAVEKLRDLRTSPPLRSEALSLRSVCTHCEYHPFECDYRNPEGPEHAVPCGGVVVLDALLDRGWISAETLYAPPRHRTAQAS